MDMETDLNNDLMCAAAGEASAVLRILANPNHLLRLCQKSQGEKNRLASSKSCCRSSNLRCRNIVAGLLVDIDTRYARAAQAATSFVEYLCHHAHWRQY